MTKFTKFEVAEIDKLCNRLRDGYDELNAAIDKYNEAVKALWEPVQKALDTYNEAISDANCYANDELTSGMQEYYDEKSEKWQQGEKGQRFDAWLQEWSTELEQVSLDEPDEADASNIEDCAETYGMRSQSAYGE